MSTNNDYPCNKAIDDLEQFLKKHIKDQRSLKDFLSYLSKCRASQKLGFRYLHEEIMSYRKEHSDYFLYSELERKMIDDLMHFWG